MKKGFFQTVFLILPLIHSGAAAWGSSLTVRDIVLNQKNQVEVKLDGVVPKGGIEVDYVRDIVQFSIQNSTIYPAKIVHAESQAFNKVFAYQYSPNLVRVRFSMEGKADDFKNKIQWQQKGKSVLISFPETADRVRARKSADKVEKVAEKTIEKTQEEREQSLLEKVLKASDTGEEKPVEKSTSHLGRKSAPVTATQQQLGGQSSGPSVLRSFLMMFLIVGGLGVVLIAVKRKKNNLQAKKVGDSWFSNLLPQSMRKSKSFMEVVAQHALGPKQSIVVMKIKGQQFVLGVTQDNVQLITQLDADEAELDLLEDPAIAASIGKMFGGKPVAQAVAPQATAAQPSGTSFQSLLKNSNGAGAVMGRQAYQTHVSAQSSAAALPISNEIHPVKAQANSIRDQIKKRLEGMKNA